MASSLSAPPCESGPELVAKAWHATADQSQKSGKDVNRVGLKKASVSLEGAAKWSGTNFAADGTQASVDGLKKAGEETNEVGKFFKSLGDGIADLGQKLSS